MPDVTIQPTKKWIRIQYWIVFLLFCVSVGLYVNKLEGSVSPWVLLIPALLFFFPVRGHLHQAFTKVVLTGDGKLRYESGMFSKTTRTIQTSKIQDVCVNQTMAQRLAGIGDLAIETSGETSKLTIENIDQPQSIAELLTDANREQPQNPKSARS